jgi:hypothetical protein
MKEKIKTLKMDQKPKASHIILGCKNCGAETNVLMLGSKLVKSSLNRIKKQGWIYNIGIN